MNENQPRIPEPTERPTSTSDDVWGVNRPPALGQTPTGYPGQDTWSSRPGPSGSDPFDRGFAALKKAPLRRDSAHGVIGGVAAGIARKTGVAPAAVRVAAVALAMFFGVGIGAYLIAWAALPDETGRTHAERAVREGRTGSMAVLGLGLIAVMGVLSWIFDSWGLLVAAAVVAFVVMKKKGHFSSHAHG